MEVSNGEIIKLIFGALSIVVVLHMIFSNKTKNNQKAQYNQDWAIFLSFKGGRIYFKPEGEIFRGPEFFQIKSSPVNIFGEEYYGGWMYRNKKGVYLQKWNSTSKPDCDLIYFDFEKLTLETKITKIKTLDWKIDNTNPITHLVLGHGTKKEKRILPK